MKVNSISTPASGLNVDVQALVGEWQAVQEDVEAYFSYQDTRLPLRSAILNVNSLN
jgi:hypothetical protein